MRDDVDQLIADTLGIQPDLVTSGLEFGGVPEWDSLGHVRLMAALEDLSGSLIDEECMIELTTVSAIRAFAAAAPGGGA